MRRLGSGMCSCRAPRRDGGISRRCCGFRSGIGQHDFPSRRVAEIHAFDALQVARCSDEEVVHVPHRCGVMPRNRLGRVAGLQEDEFRRSHRFGDSRGDRVTGDRPVVWQASPADRRFVRSQEVLTVEHGNRCGAPLELRRPLVKRVGCQRLCQELRGMRHGADAQPVRFLYAQSESPIEPANRISEKASSRNQNGRARLSSQPRFESHGQPRPTQQTAADFGNACWNGHDGLHDRNRSNSECRAISVFDSETKVDSGSLTRLI